MMSCWSACRHFSRCQLNRFIFSNLHMCLGPSHIDNYGIGYKILTVNSQRDITQSVGLKHEKVVTID